MRIPGLKAVQKLLKNHRYRIRKSKVMASCGCVCFCPECNDILNDQAHCSITELPDADIVHYKCTSCGQVSKWAFHIAPVPILLEKLPALPPIDLGL